MIDLRKADLLESALTLPFTFVMPNTLFEDEWLDLSAKEKRELQVQGLEVHDLPGPLVQKAARYANRHRQLKLNDCFALTLAEDIEGSILLTGDRTLRRVAEDRGLKVHGVLWVVDELEHHETVSLQRLYAMAADWEMAPDGINPCRGIVRHRERPRERFLTDTEFRRLGEALSEAPSRGGVSVHAVAAIRLLMLTGCRKSEILSLRWRDVDLDAGELKLPDSKTGPRAVPLSPPAARVLADLPRVDGNPWVIPGQKPGARMTNLDGPWWIVRRRAKLDGVRIHDLRHSFASRALALGESLPAIAKLLGHSQIQTTARYAHLARDSVKASAARVADSIAGDFLRPDTAPKTPRR